VPVLDADDYYVESQTGFKLPITGGWSFSNFVLLSYTNARTIDSGFQSYFSTGIEYQF